MSDFASCDKLQLDSHIVHEEQSSIRSIIVSVNEALEQHSAMHLKIKIYKTIKLSVVIYSCEAWSLALREECRLKVCEKQDSEANIWTQDRCEWGVEKSNTMRNFIVRIVHLT